MSSTPAFASSLTTTNSAPSAAANNNGDNDSAVIDLLKRESKPKQFQALNINELYQPPADTSRTTGWFPSC